MEAIVIAFKKAFLEGYASYNVSIFSAISAIAVTLLLGIYIFFIYRTLTRKTFYSKNFNIALVGVSLITSAIIVTVQSSVVVSLGMVGALSIVRFRTAIKDPMDLMFLFWAISNGIICGAGFAAYAIVLSVVLTIIVVLLNKAPVVRAPMILIVNTTDISAESAIMDSVQKYTKRATVKSRNMTAVSLDLTIELRVEDGADLVNELVSIPGTISASLLSHDGEVTF